MLLNPMGVFWVEATTLCLRLYLTNLSVKKTFKFKGSLGLWIPRVISSFYIQFFSIRRISSGTEEMGKYEGVEHHFLIYCDSEETKIVL